MAPQAPTAQGLDWPVLVDALADCARTPLGAAAVRALRPLSLEEVTAAWDGIAELRSLEDAGTPVPIGDVVDIAAELRRAAKGEVLEIAALQRAAGALGALVVLARVLERHEEVVPTLLRFADAIHIDPLVRDELDRAFDATGQLSATTYPLLGELRDRIASLHTEVRGTLDGLVKGDTLGDMLQDRFWTQRSERYVLPVKSWARRGDLGIVHGTSGSGQTLFVEPHAVVALNNRLRVAEGELAAEEHRILAALSASLGTVRDPGLEALAAAAALDLIAAREALARRLDAWRPATGSQGVIQLERARHPVLVLRGVPVVPNDMALSPGQPALVLSGANAGGKTVALKTIGLCALLVQHGCFVPAAETSRVDLFPAILAAIGDQQTVEHDLSSFSAHLVELAAMIEAAPGALLLLDELASGTDPAQGAALAQAVVERLIEAGARVVVTTHHARLKALAAADPRVQVAAVEHAGGQPTYRLIPGATGESHAFTTALRMGLDPELVARARGLMDDAEVQLAEALEALEIQRTRAEQLTRELDVERRDLEAKEARIRSQAEALRQQASAAFLKRLDDAEKAVGQVVAALQRDPDHRRADAARATIGALRDLAPDRAPVPEPLPASVRPGDRVRLRLGNKEGEVLRVKDDVLHVRTGSVTLKIRADQVVHCGAPPPRPQATAAPRRRAPQTGLEEALRMTGNTLDMRGMRVDEGLDAIDLFLDQATLAGQDVVFLLHGHGTGALKEGVRRWLRGAAQVDAWAPATADQGGDALTVVRIA